MAKVGKIFKCNACGNQVVVIKEGKNPKVGCCGKPMNERKI